MDKKEEYKRISCDQYDQLEAWAVKKQLISLIYLDEAGREHNINAFIKTLETKNRSEYIHLSDGTVIRLDKIQKMNI